MNSSTGNHAGKIVYVNTTGEPDAGKLAGPVRWEATRKRTLSQGAPRRVADPTQTLKRWLSQRAPAATLVELNAELLGFSRIYNIERPHRALDRRTPDQAYAALPKAFPQCSGAGKHYRVRTNRVDVTDTVTLRHHGTLLHLGVGRAHAGESIKILVTDNDAAVFETDTGEVLADFILDATKPCQPKKKKSPEATED